MEKCKKKQYEEFKKKNKDTSLDLILLEISLKILTFSEAKRQIYSLFNDKD